mmetsp:Transcript_12315/g.26213  ORF Transcript_12315/g.26213 Transcript_12315/m.26213 type:complete len:84 (-) Transcript_12315:47-298(-)
MRRDSDVVLEERRNDEKLFATEKKEMLLDLLPASEQLRLPHRQRKTLIIKANTKVGSSRSAYKYVSEKNQCNYLMIRLPDRIR